MSSRDIVACTEVHVISQAFRWDLCSQPASNPTGVVSEGVTEQVLMVCMSEVAAKWLCLHRLRFRTTTLMPCAPLVLSLVLLKYLHVL